MQRIERIAKKMEDYDAGKVVLMPPHNDIMFLLEVARALRSEGGEVMAEHDEVRIPDGETMEQFKERIRKSMLPCPSCAALREAVEWAMSPEGKRFALQLNWAEFTTELRRMAKE